MIMKRLKDTTIQRYDAGQLRRHLDRLLNAFDCAPYRINQYQVLHCISSTFEAYYPYCDLYDRDAIIDAINDVYRRLGM